MNKLDVKIGDKFNDYTVISEPFIEDGKYEMISCKCKCGHIGKFYKCNIKRLKKCKTCTNRDKNRKYNPGDKIGNFTFVEYTETYPGKTSGLLKCNACENIIDIAIYQSRLNKTCGCIRNLKGIEHPSYKGLKNVSATYFSQIKLNSIKKNREFDISIEYIDNLMTEQNNRCSLSGIEIKIGNSSEETTASLDRKDSSKGYIEGNVQWVHKDINRMKTDFDTEHFKYLCKNIYEFLKL